MTARSQVQESDGVTFRTNTEGRNERWLVCRRCLVAWPPNDIRPGAV